MTRRSQRELERELASLGTDDDRDPLVFVTTRIEDGGEWPEVSDSPHPELTVRRMPDRKPGMVVIAVPNVLPEPYRDRGEFLAVTSCGTSDSHGVDPDTSNCVLACELWDAMSDAELCEEYRVREERGDPVPSFLEGWGCR